MTTQRYGRLRSPPFADDTSTLREIAFAKIAARVEGTAMAAEVLGG